MTSGIYRILNKENKKFYIGSAVNFKGRLANHLCLLRKNSHKNLHLQNAWNKYGEDNFNFELILICDIENLIYYEQSLIDALKPQYNLNPTAGSPLGRKLSSSTKKKIGDANRGNKTNVGRIHSEDSKIKMSLSKKGKKFSEQHKKRISDGKKGKYNPKIIYDGFISPEGIEHRDIFNLKKFCRDNNLTYQNMYQVSKGLKKSHRGWIRIWT